jgi:DNA-binding CsgD family transcriptional regulator
MHSTETILELVDLTYKAAANPECWTTLIERLASVTGGISGTIHHQNRANLESSFSTSWGLDPSALVLYANYYGFRNPFVTTKPELIKSGTVYPSQVWCPDETFLRSEYYNDYWQCQGLHHLIGAILQNDKTTFSVLSIFRPAGGVEFDETECLLLRALMPHLQRAFQLHSKIQGLEKKARVIEETLNGLSAAIVLLDHKGYVIFANKLAEALFKSQTYLRLSSTGLRAAQPAEDKRLASIIHSAVTTGTGNGGHSGGTISISRGAVQSPMHVLVSPLRTETLYFGKSVPAVAIFISDPEREPCLPAEWLQHLYDLTPAEARLAHLLVSGNDLKQAAEELRVGISTVRSQLKSIFAKTNTSRQSDLIRRLLMGPAQFFQGASAPKS